MEAAEDKEESPNVGFESPKIKEVKSPVFKTEEVKDIEIKKKMKIKKKGNKSPVKEKRNEIELEVI